MLLSASLDEGQSTECLKDGPGLGTAQPHACSWEGNMPMDAYSPEDEFPALACRAFGDPAPACKALGTGA